MQRPIPKARAASVGMSQIAKTLMLPHENPPMRLPTFPNLERTAVCGFETNLETSSSFFGLSTRRYVLFRSPSAPFWYDQKVTDNDASRGQFSYMFKTVGDQEVVSPEVQAAGLQAPIGTLGGDRWLYFPCHFDGASMFATAMFVHSEGNPLLMDYTVMVDDGSSASYTATVGTGMSVLDGTNDKPCWVRVNSLKCTIAGQTGRLIVYPPAGARALWPAYSPPQAEVSVAPYTATRVTALSLLATNVSRVQIKQGTIMGARFSALTPAFWSALPSHVNGVHPAERYYGACENGLYLVAPPTQDSELFHDSVVKTGSLYGVSSSGVPTYSLTSMHHVPLMYFDSDDPFLAAFISEEAGIDETLMALTIDIHLEYRTSSPLFQVGISAIPLETYHAAQLVVAQAGYFYENSTHWKDLAVKVARLATQVIPMLYPSSRAAKVAGAAALLLGRSNRADMTQRQMVKPRPKQPTRKKKAKVKTPPRKR